jgi:hypothetical protein
MNPATSILQPRLTAAILSLFSGGKSRPSLRGKVIIVKSSNSDSHGICFFDGLCKSVSASEPSFGRSGHTRRRLIDDDPGD